MKFVVTTEFGTFLYSDMSVTAAIQELLNEYDLTWFTVRLIEFEVTADLTEGWGGALE